MLMPAYSNCTQKYRHLELDHYRSFYIYTEHVVSQICLSSEKGLAKTIFDAADGGRSNNFSGLRVLVRFHTVILHNWSSLYLYCSSSLLAHLVLMLDQLYLQGGTLYP